MELFDDGIVPEEAREVKQDAREFAQEHITPNAAESFASGEYPWDILEAGMEAGLVAQDIGEEWGGQGFSLQQVLAIAEEFYCADAGIALTLQLASFGAEIVEEHADDWQKEEFLRPVAENDQITGLAVSEPQTGSDLAGMSTRAEKASVEESSADPSEAKASKEGDEWVLNGEKYWIGNGVEADWVTLYAKTGDDENDRYGNYSLFIVPTDTDGYEAEHVPEKMAMRASKQAHITLEDCRIPENHLIGIEGAGFYMLAEFFNHGRVIVGGQGIGLAAAAIEETTEFVHDREAFGRTVDEFQAVQHHLADMRLEFEAARALVWRATDKVTDKDNAGYWAALAKTKATETATDCAETGMKLHGGRSVLTDRRIARVFRDSRIPVIYEGANDVQRDLIYRQAPR